MATTLSPQRPQSVSASKDPFSVLRKEMDELISSFWGGGTNTSILASNHLPALDMVDSENAVILKLDMPGMNAADLDIQVHGNVVAIRGERKEEKEVKDKTYYKMERRYGSVARTITLPCDVNDGEAVAEYNNGVLTLTLPKAEGAKAKKIQVKG